MGLRDRFRRLEKTMQGRLAYFELSGGQRFYFDPHEAFSITFRFFADSMLADHKREPRPEPPELLKAVADAKDRGEALSRVMGGCSHLPLDREALVSRGEFVPRSLVAGRTYDEILENRSEP
ncbi:MAG: hypothetical protein LC781_03750 [Actinobacteria bacterium]|nr:hypothetical protein [Actinomycetota bacterium]MCA1715995.1 hypothetical protein [Actinomycetota bacterium]